MIIAVDFDGTLVEHKFPEIGNENPDAFDILKLLQGNGHQLILYTMRSGHYLEEAVDYCASKGITFWGVNENPEQETWTSSAKIYAHIYIDDASVGTPMKDGSVDWLQVFHILNNRGLIDV